MGGTWQWLSAPQEGLRQWGTARHAQDITAPQDRCWVVLAHPQCRTPRTLEPHKPWGPKYSVPGHPKHHHLGYPRTPKHHKHRELSPAPILPALLMPISQLPPVPAVPTFILPPNFPCQLPSLCYSEHQGSPVPPTPAVSHSPTSQHQPFPVLPALSFLQYLQLGASQSSPLLEEGAGCPVPPKAPLRFSSSATRSPTPIGAAMGGLFPPQTSHPCALGHEGKVGLVPYSC